MTKDQGKDYHGRQGLDYRPCGSDDRLLIPHLDISPNEKVKKLPEFPKSRQIQVEKSPPRLNPNGGACGYISQGEVSSEVGRWTVFHTSKCQHN
jgi:hypothetical protein